MGSPPSPPPSDLAGSAIAIGKVPLTSPLTQAALSGYSDWPMRLVARRHGAAYTLCEVMLDQFLVRIKDRRRNRHLLYRSEDERPVGGQLMGADPELFAEGARRLVAAGFDVIDINFGCPVKKVVGKCRGGYHLGQPDVALEIIQRTRDAVPPDIPVTLKMRKGIDDSAQSRDHFYRILEGAFDAGIAAVTVHGRTVEQRYVGPSDWEFLAEVKRFLGERLLFGSGDLFSPHDCVRMLRETGVDGLSVARGAIGNPWIFPRTLALLAGRPLPPPPTLHEQRNVMWEHYRLAESIYGEKRTPVLMRKFGIKYARLHPRYPDVRQSMVRVRSRADFRAALDRWYADDLPGVEPVCDE